MADTRARTGFTMTELMVAVAVLVVVIVASSRIFQTASSVAGLGQATADLLLETATIERQLRDDFERLSSEGFIVIRCVEVPNDINLATNGRLLNPALPPNASIRADQLFLFVEGAQQMMTFRGGPGQGTNVRGVGYASRVYYGHGVQLREGRAVSGTGNNPQQAHDPVVDLDAPLTPWHTGQYAMVMTTYGQGNPSGTEYNTANGQPIDATQPEARRWLLARHAVVMADDGPEDHNTGALNWDNLGAVYQGNRTAYSIDHEPVFQGRVDGASQTLNALRQLITTDFSYDPPIRPWRDNAAPNGDQMHWIRTITGRQFNRAPIYTRAESLAPSMMRVDQALTNHVLATNCSSFRVEWTYGPGTGEVRNQDGTIRIDPNNVPMTGVITNLTDPPYREQPWFGLRDDARGVLPYYANGAPLDTNWWRGAYSIDPANIEGEFPLGNIRIYEAIFGYNQSEPIDAAGFANTDLGYTPFPTAIRITMVLHDPELRLEQGREVQFVLNLPKRR